MNPPSEPQPRQRRYRVRHQARLDPETHAHLEEPVFTFHRKQSAILPFVMPWALRALAAQYTQNWEAHRQHSQLYAGRGVR